MNKPDALTHRTVQELRALLKGGGRIKVEHLKDLAKYAIFQELEWRDKEADIVRGFDNDPTEYIEELEEQVEGHAKEIEELEQKHEEAMIAFAKEGAEIEL